jgi:hypothetical protein
MWAGHDPDDSVRNNAVRALAVLAQSSSAMAARIPASGFIDMLNSGTWVDRNKGAFLLGILSARRDSEWVATAPYAWVPPEHRWRLPLLYVVFVTVIILLYFPCRWFAGVKARRQRGWLRYL